MTTTDYENDEEVRAGFRALLAENPDISESEVEAMVEKLMVGRRVIALLDELWDFRT